MTWRTLGVVLPEQLVDARLQLHWAAQLVSAPGASLLLPKSDFSHTNLVWDAALGVLSGHDLGTEGLRAALVFEGLELIVLQGSRERDSLRLAGHSLQQALSWLGERLCDDPNGLSLPEHEMPAHAVGEGARFSDGGAEERIELAAWFADASAAVREAVAPVPSASPVRCWPHHFDLASLITLDPGEDAEHARSVGVGLSPGDGSYAQPYFYVTPWPYPTTEALPALASAARWHTEGWTGAVLTGERLLSVTPDKQEQTVREALHDAVAVCRSLLEP